MTCVVTSSNFKYNLDWKVQSWKKMFISGIYFSQFPAVSLAFGQVLLCRVLTGRIEEAVEENLGSLKDTEISDEFDSRRVVGILWDKTPGKSIVHIVKDPDRVLPFCVIHLERNVASGLNKISFGDQIKEKIPRHLRCGVVKVMLRVALQP